MEACNQVHIYWEGHKIFAKSPPFFDWYYIQRFRKIFVAFPEYMNFKSNNLCTKKSVVATIFLKSRFFLKSGFLKSRQHCTRKTIKEISPWCLANSITQTCNYSPDNHFWFFRYVYLWHLSLLTTIKVYIIQVDSIRKINSCLVHGGSTY